MAILRITGELVNKSGFVNVGIDHDTAEFAVESIRRWWRSCGKALYPEKKELLITADGGGSNGARNRLWKKQLQELANEEQLTITVAHYPPATSKWNKIEHRLFSFISINWRAKPLISLEVVLELLSHTTTKEGLAVTAVKDSNVYPAGIKVSDEVLAAFNLSTHSFHNASLCCCAVVFPVHGLRVRSISQCQVRRAKPGKGPRLSSQMGQGVGCYTVLQCLGRRGIPYQSGALPLHVDTRSVSRDSQTRIAFPLSPSFSAYYSVDQQMRIQSTRMGSPNCGRVPSIKRAETL